MDHNEIDDRFYTCPECNGEGKVLIPLTYDDMQEMDITELYDICEKCNGLGILEIEPPDSCDLYHQHGDF